MVNPNWRKLLDLVSFLIAMAVVRWFNGPLNPNFWGDIALFYILLEVADISRNIRYSKEREQ